MKLNLKHNGKFTTKCKIGGKNCGMDISEMKITIVGGEAPIIEFKGRLDKLKFKLDELKLCDVRFREEDDLSTK